MILDHVSDGDQTRPAQPAETQIDLGEVPGPPDRPAARRARLTWVSTAARSGAAQLAGATRALISWSRRPAGRLCAVGAAIALLVAGAGSAGAFLVPATAQPLPATAAPTGSAPSTPPADLPLPPQPDQIEQPAFPTIPPGEEVVGVREADKLAAWAAPIATRTGIPVVALQAYGYAEWVLSQELPTCKLSWPTLAAIAKAESNHGRADGASLGTDGRALPPIMGLPLDGRDGRRLIQDTDGGSLDNDGVYDRALGPMQFIPESWRSVEVDADNDGLRDVNDIDDASLAAARYLCAGTRDLTTAPGWREAILSYNRVESYLQAVLTAANDYAERSRNTP